MILILGPAYLTAVAAPPDDLCEAKKLKTAGSYASCRLKAKAKAELRGTVPEYAKCEGAFAKNFAKAEEKAGPGVCPSEGDAGQIDDTVAECTGELATALAADDGCPASYWNREPFEAYEDLFVALAAEDWDAVACNYHENAFVTDDQGVLIGRAEIVGASMSLYDLFDGVDPVVGEVNVFRDTVRVLFSLDAGWVHIEDGVITLVVRHGKVTRQTTHGVITFSGPPPD